MTLNKKKTKGLKYPKTMPTNGLPLPPKQPKSRFIKDGVGYVDENGIKIDLRIKSND